jgi:hypothetical protein
MVGITGWLVAAAPNAGSELQWWQVVTGVLGIPTAFVTILGGYRLAQKTRLESRKLQLEIDKETAAPMDTPATALAVSSSGLVAIGDLVTRFVVLSLLLLAWNLIESLVNPLIYFLVFKVGLHPNSELGALGVNYISLILDLPRFAIFFLIGWPLLLDISRSLGISPRDLLRMPRRVTPRRPRARTASS